MDRLDLVVGASPGKLDWEERNEPANKRRRLSEGGLPLEPDAGFVTVSSSRGKVQDDDGHRQDEEQVEERLVAASLLELNSNSPARKLKRKRMVMDAVMVPVRPTAKSVVRRGPSFTRKRNYDEFEDSDDVFSDGSRRKSLMPSSSSDDNRYAGQVTPHHLVSPTLRRVRDDDSPSSDDSIASRKPPRLSLTLMSDQLLDTPAKHPFSFSGLLDSAWNTITETAFKTGWTPVARLSEAAVVALMQNMNRGSLRVLTYSHIYSFPAVGPPEGDAEVKAELRVLNDAFWIRLATMGDLGFAESYMYGEVVSDDLVSLFQASIFLANRSRLSNLDSKASYLFTLPQRLTSYRFLNTLSNSRSNISAHYDISNEMFAGFLSPDMTYSCAIFEDLDGDMKEGVERSEWSGGQGLLRLGPKSAPTTPAAAQTEEPFVDELYDAQIRKLSHIIKKAKIQPGNRVLEIGSGWGSMAIHLAQTVPDTTVDTLTLSVHQQTLARERIAAAGLSDRIKVHLMDYRSMPAEWQNSFDRVISVEMIEAVGQEFLVKYWEVVDWAMKKEGGVGCVQVITIPEARFERYIREIDFIRKWVQYVPFSGLFISLISLVFPGGFLPTLTFLLQTMKDGSGGRLTVDSVSNIGPHYARTLREWRRRFLYAFDSTIVPALKREYPDVMNGPRGKDEIEVFKRKWIYYYCYCEVGFTSRTLADHIVTFTREGCTDYGCTVFE
ncbi:hypothetical protein HMN09_00966200 [Mycena chlorophos]|uniref:Cyclopropane-fatty-acyl-phospholipid synthase n=1 Tax=Mycena chlorophos TaxID=658473 RepID=A0A8H6SHC0_MYCCL|nr:hypothetical protein HMN09_00966200 [Mycena chlorophos]